MDHSSLLFKAFPGLKWLFVLLDVDIYNQIVFMGILCDKEDEN